MSLRDNFIEWWTEEHGHPPASEWVICAACKGDGKHGPGWVFTAEDREEMGHEFDELMDDLRAGYYDVACEGCGGSGKVREFREGSLAEHIFETWQYEEIADRRTRWAESGYPQ